MTEETLAEAGLIRKGKGPAKLLANGDAARGVTVRGDQDERGRPSRKSKRPEAG